MTVTGPTFDRMRVTPKDDALFYNMMMQGINRCIRGYKKNLNLVVSGLNVNIDTGAAIIYGRMVEVTELHRLTVPANTSGYIVLTIDLTQENTSTGTPGNSDYLPINNQVSAQVVDKLVQQNLMNDGLIYMYPLASYKSTGTSVSITNMREYAYQLTLQTGWVPYYSTMPVAIDMGDFIMLNGIVKNTAQIASGAQSMIAKLPSGLEPFELQEIARFKGWEHWGLIINTDGEVTFSSYTNKDGALAYPTGSWTTLSGVTYIKTSSIRRN